MKLLRNIIIVLAIVVVIIALFLGIKHGLNSNRSQTQEHQTSSLTTSTKSATKIGVTIGNHSYKAHLYDNSAANALKKRLPMTLSFDNFGAGFDEKIGDLSTKLSTKGMPNSSDAGAGEIGYWSPQPRVVLYYGHVDEYDGIHIIGQFDDSRTISALKNQTGKFTVTINKASK